MWVGAALLCWVAGLIALWWAYRSDLDLLWREPVFRRPVVVIESDDWGAGPVDQAQALDSIAGVLLRHRDGLGRPAVLNLAVVLAVPDGPAIAATGGYHRVDLDHPAHTPTLAALRRGEQAGVFALQLHGLEHFWPPSVMASGNPQVQTWLRSTSVRLTEDLPPALQSRWVDACQLPTAPLPAEAVEQAVADEVRTYARVFGQPPEMVVPPTFVWTPAVEQAWAAGGVRGVVTPGRRYVARDASGVSVDDGLRFANGDRRGTLTYLVRSDYFEPIKGRDAAYALAAVARARVEGRACLLENHRVNFCRDAGARLHSLTELEALLAGILRQAPQTAFLSTAALRQILSERDPTWLVGHWRDRLPRWWRRLQTTGRLWKLLRWSGAAAVGALLLRPWLRDGAAGHV